MIAAAAFAHLERQTNDVLTCLVDPTGSGTNPARFTPKDKRTHGSKHMILEFLKLLATKPNQRTFWTQLRYAWTMPFPKLIGPHGRHLR